MADEEMTLDDIVDILYDLRMHALEMRRPHHGKALLRAIEALEEESLLLTNLQAAQAKITEQEKIIASLQKK